MCVCVCSFARRNFGVTGSGVSWLSIISVTYVVCVLVLFVIPSVGY